MGLNALSQDDRLELCFLQRIYLVHLELPSKTLYLSDRNYTYDYGSIQNYENYLFDLTNLPVEIMRMSGNLNYRVTLRFRNDRILTHNHLIEMDSSHRFCFATVKIYELRLVESGETFASDVKTLLFRGVAGQPYDITRREFKIDVHNMMLALRDRLPLQVIDTAVDSGADPDDIGKIRNTVIGAVENIVCRCVKGGAIDNLRDDLDDDDTSFYVSGSSKITFASSGTIQIDDEKITYTGFSSYQFTGCTRGASSTTAVAHDRGTPVAAVLTEYIYEAAKHPMKSIDVVKVDKVKQTANFTAYTGLTGDELTGYSGRAVVKFTVLPLLVRQTNLDLNDTIGVTESGHAHSTTEQYTTDGTGSLNSSSGVDNPSNAIDDNNATYATLDSPYDWAKYDFAIGTPPGTLNYIKILVRHAYVQTNADDYKISVDGGTPQYIPKGTSAQDTWFTFSIAQGASWSPTIQIGNNSSGTTVTLYIYEVKEVRFYYGGNDTGSQTSGATRTGTVSLIGNSVADTVIGRVVHVDGEGCRDDGSGTYTGSANALIERPDHVFKYLLVGLLGESASDIGSSFATSGALYASTYKFGFVLHDISKRADALLQKLAFQCRSKFLEWHGKFELIYMGSAPSVSRTFTEDDCLDEPVFGYTPEIDIKNRIYARYKRDYLSAGEYDAVESDDDSSSITDNGERVETVDLPACRTQAMASNWVSWYLTQRKQEWKTTKLTVPWIGKILDAGQTFSLTWDLWTGITWDPLSMDMDPMRERVRITGQAWPV